MGLGKFWSTVATLATLSTAPASAFHPGTQPAGYCDSNAVRAAVHVAAPTSLATNCSWGLPDRIKPTGQMSGPAKATSTAGRGDAAPPLIELIEQGDGYFTVRVNWSTPADLMEPETAILDIAGEPDTPPTPQARVVADIRALTDLSWPRIARLVGVERQTIYRWRNGEPADELKLRQASTVLDILQEARHEHGTGRDLCAWLQRPAPLHGASPLDLIAEGRYEEARFLAMLAPSRVTSISDRSRDTESWDRYIAEEERAYRD